MHQLAAPGAIRPGVVAGLPRRRTGRHRSPHAGVRVRARDRPRAAGDDGARDRLPGRGRQRLRDLERLRQPLLAGALLRRHGRHHPRPPLRRRTLRGIGARHPAAARRRARARVRRRARRRGGGRLGPPAHARDVSRLRAGRALRVTDGAAFDEPRTYKIPERLRSTTGRSPASGRSGSRMSCSTRPAGASPTLPRARRPSRAVARSARADPVPRAPRRPGSRPVARRGRRRGRKRPCSGTAASTSSCAQHGAVRERTLEITFLEPGAEAYAFTFG